MALKRNRKARPGIMSVRDKLLREFLGLAFSKPGSLGIAVVARRFMLRFKGQDYTVNIARGNAL